MAFDPETNRKIDERKEREHFEKTGKHKKFIKKEYKTSVRGIRSSYDKRIITDEGLMSKPIHLN